MKNLIFAVMFALPVAANAAGGALVYEAAASSSTVAVVTLSSTTPTLISKTPSTTIVSGQPPVQWYSITGYNVNADYGVYAFSTSATAGPIPALTCSNGAIIGAGTTSSPWHFTEQFIGMYMYGLSCKSSGTLALRVVYRGR